MKCFDSCISPPSAFLSKMASGEVEVGGGGDVETHLVTSGALEQLPWPITWAGGGRGWRPSLESAAENSCWWNSCFACHAPSRLVGLLAGSAALWLLQACFPAGSLPCPSFSSQPSRLTPPSQALWWPSVHPHPHLTSIPHPPRQDFLGLLETKVR